MTETKHVPDWLDIDKVLPVELRDQVPGCRQAADELLDTILSFTERWMPYLDEVARTVGATAGTNRLDGWDNFIDRIIGLDVAHDRIFLAVYAISQIDWDSMPTDEYAMRLYGAATPEQQRRIDALKARRPPLVDLETEEEVAAYLKGRIETLNENEVTQ